MSFSNIYRRAKRLFGVDVPGGMEWFEDAGDPAELIAIDRVINNNVFSTKEGGYFAVFACAGIDDECLSNEQLQAVSASVRGAQQRLDGIVAYHVAVKKRSTRRIHKHANSANPVVAQAQQEREDHLASQGLCQIELFIALYVPPTLNWQTWWPESHAKAIKSQLKKLDDAIRIFPIMLGNFGLRLLSTVEASDVYGYIANLTDDYAGLEPRGDVSKILARSRIGWNDDGLRIGQQFARVFSLLIEPQWTRPNMFGDLLKIDADMVLVFECSRRSADETRAAADSQEAFLNVFREKLRTVLAYIGDRNADMYLNMGPRSATSQATDKSVKKVSDVLDDLQNGFGYTESSLIGLIHGSNSAVLDEKMAEIHTFANKSQMVIHREGIAALCGYATLFPGAKMGGVSTNVRRRWLRDDHAANMSLMYAPCRGEAFSETLQDECLAYFQTRDNAEFAYDPYNSRGVRGCFVMGESGRGKTFLLNFMAEQQMKYGGWMFIFDVGNGYGSTVKKYGGAVVRLGVDRLRLNPFGSSEDPDIRFAQRFVRMLLLNGGAVIKPNQEAEINSRVTRLCTFGNGSMRKLSNLVLPNDLQSYLAKWSAAGVYSSYFDNSHDELEDLLQSARIVAFDFEGIGESGDQDDLMQPLLTWIRWRIARYTNAPENIMLPKLEMHDEVWRYFLLDDKISELMGSEIVRTTKTGRKRLSGIVMATHTPHDLGDYAQTIRTNCPDVMLLGGPIPRKEYEIFNLNEQQLELIDGLEDYEFLFDRAGAGVSKVLKLTVDSKSWWHYTTKPRDQQIRDLAIEEHGFEKAFEYLASAELAKKATA